MSPPRPHSLLLAAFLLGRSGSGLGIARGSGSPWHRPASHRQRQHLRPEQQRRLRQASRQRLRRSVPAPRHAAGGSRRPWHCPWQCAGIVTPSGSGRSDRCFDSFMCISERSSSMNSGRSFGRQEISTSAMRCDTTPPCDLHARRSGLALEVDRDVDADLLGLRARAAGRRARWRCAPGASADP